MKLLLSIFLVGSVSQLTSACWAFKNMRNIKVPSRGESLQKKFETNPACIELVQASKEGNIGAVKQLP